MSTDRPFWCFLVAISAAVLVGGSLVGGMLLAGRRAPADKATEPVIKWPEGKTVAAAPAAALEQPKLAGKYPWPECEAVVAYLRGHANDAGSVEIVSWDSRKVQRPGEPTDHYANGKPILSTINATHIEVHFRARNQYGAIQINHAILTIREGGKIVLGYSN